MKPRIDKLRVAVSGASGFIGRHVVKELEQTNVRVIALASEEKEGLPTVKNGLWVFHDHSQVDDMVFQRLDRPDVMIHLAWQGLPNYDSLHHFETELPRQYRFLKSMICQGLKNLVVAGTCLEYGMQSGPLQADNETNPVTAYGVAKDMLRRQLELLQRKDKFALTWARLFYMYGDGQASTSLYSQLKTAVRKKEKKFRMSGGEQLRDFLPVVTVARKLVEFALHRKNIGVMNICSGQPISIRRIVEKWINENNWNIQPDLGHYHYPEYEPMAFWGQPAIQTEENTL